MRFSKPLTIVSRTEFWKCCVLCSSFRVTVIHPPSHALGLPLFPASTPAFTHQQPCHPSTLPSLPPMTTISSLLLLQFIPFHSLLCLFYLSLLLAPCSFTSLFYPFCHCLTHPTAIICLMHLQPFTFFSFPLQDASSHADLLQKAAPQLPTSSSFCFLYPNKKLISLSRFIVWEAAW